MSIKRISRRRVAALPMDYVDEELTISNDMQTVDTIASAPGGSRTGGDIETKASALVVGGAVQARVGGNVETRDGSSVGSRYGTK